MKRLLVGVSVLGVFATASTLSPTGLFAQSSAHLSLRRATATYASHAVNTPTTSRSATTIVGARGISTKALTEVVQKYCVNCHSPTMRRGNLNLRGFVVDSAFENDEVAEKIIRKMRAEMMPPPGSRRPAGDTLIALIETIEKVMDVSAPTNPGSRTFQRLNRPEYERVVRDLFGLEVNAGDWLPLDTKSANFDNISDVQSMSPTLLDGYLNAAAAVSRMAIGDRSAGS